MKKYICHKIVKAARIQGEYENTLILGEGQEVRLTDPDKVRFANMASDSGLSVVDGYFVRYGNGYISWSPADVFEKGYTEVPLNDTVQVLDEVILFLRAALGSLADLDDPYPDVISLIANMLENVRYTKNRVKEENE